MIVLVAGIAAAAAPHPALDAVDAGDARWWSGERAAGVESWRAALDLVDPSPEGQAAALMARLRLMQAGSTLSPIVHGRAVDRAVDGCYDGDLPRGPWCRLAIVDYWLFAPAPIGDRARAAEIAATLTDELPGPAASRLALATGDRAALEALDPAERDGLGEALLAGPEWVPGPWVVGVGFLAGPPSGVGLGLHLVHPDVGRARVLVAGDAFLALRAAGLSGRVETPGRLGLVVDADLRRWPWWDGEGWVPVDTARIAAGPLLRIERLRVEAGPVARWDVDRLVSDEAFAGHGLWGAASIGFGEDRASARIGVSGDWTLPGLADYERLGGVVHVRGGLPLFDGVIAARLRWEGAAGEMPEVRLPTVGGAYVLRGANYGELRGPWTAAADLELRHPVWGPLWAAAFVDAAHVDGAGLHGGGGGGIRLALPPQPQNTVRIDVAATDLGWGVYVAWGEAF